MNVFITKYALTKGILNGEAEPSQFDPDIQYPYVTIFWPKGHKSQHALFRSECATTMDEAVEQVNKKISAKIKSLKKQINKLEGTVIVSTQETE
jgi:hypothetical protein